MLKILCKKLKKRDSCQVKFFYKSGIRYQLNATVLTKLLKNINLFRDDWKIFEKYAVDLSWLLLKLKKLHNKFYHFHCEMIM